MAISIYPKRTSAKEDFRGVKVVVQPNQSMTLRDILKRFIRRESLPVEKNGVYIDNMGDLEKLSREDITVRMERATELRSNLSKAEKRMKDKPKPEAKADATPKAGGEAPEPTAAGKGAAPAPSLATP